MFRIFWTLMLTASTAVLPRAVAEEPAATLSFDRDIRPILSENCYACHGFDAEAREAGLRLDNREGAVDEGGVIEPGAPDTSSLVARIVSTDDSDRMPPPDSGKQLTSVQIEKLKRWIREGAAYEMHWAFVPPEKVTPEKVPPGNTANDRSSDAELPMVHPIDALIRKRLADAQLSPSPPAEPATLIRRVSLDLTGLPPSVEEIAAFEEAYASDATAAYETLVDRLLASPHYGERWGRWWLDQARYADSNGYSIDGPRQIWLYRDWVVNALNDDMPFDQFTIEQLAGDLLPGATDSQRVATGFHRNTPINQEGGIDREQFRIDSVFDRVATTGTVWLGLTVGCAQCHDHKFDPLTQREFYELFAFFNDQDEPSITVYPDEVDAVSLKAEEKSIRGEQDAMLANHTDAVAEWLDGLDETTMSALPNAVQKAAKLDAKKRSADNQWMLIEASHVLGDRQAEQGAQWEAWTQRLKSIKQELDRGVSTMVLAERSQPRESTVLIKGDFTRRDAVVKPGTPDVLHRFEYEGDRATRLDLAYWIVSPDNPLTARVIVNRIWQQYFGRGLVETESDFGLQGTSPTHPELLDWLAIELQQSGWSLKELHRQIVLSQTYCQSSRVRSELAAADPLNLLLGRQNRLRLDAEIVRDTALVASGLFSPKLGGPPVYPPIPDGVMSLGQVRRGWNASTGADRYRRGLYTFVFRATPPPALNVFDAPDGQSSCTRRIRSNTPLQALTLMNDAAFFEFAQSLQRIIESDGIDVAFMRCTSRQPSDDERAVLERLDSLTAARVLLNLDETINRE